MGRPLQQTLQRRRLQEPDPVHVLRLHPARSLPLHRKIHRSRHGPHPDSQKSPPGRRQLAHHRRTKRRRNPHVAPKPGLQRKRPRPHNPPGKMAHRSQKNLRTTRSRPQKTKTRTLKRKEMEPRIPISFCVEGGEKLKGHPREMPQNLPSQSWSMSGLPWDGSR